jgi:hypothetical protein
MGRGIFFAKPSAGQQTTRRYGRRNMFEKVPATNDDQECLRSRKKDIHPRWCLQESQRLSRVFFGMLFCLRVSHHANHYNVRLITLKLIDSVSYALRPSATSLVRGLEPQTTQFRGSESVELIDQAYLLAIRRKDRHVFLFRLISVVVRGR